ncbi:MAG: glycosyltransferase [Candidatus Delongbacteria bacterium]|nr:glycosyltransferase [Candidatus Delongbacteria bacterium]
MVHFFDRNCNWDSIQRLIRRCPDQSDSWADENCLIVRLFGLCFIFIRSRFQINQLYSGNIKDYHGLVNDMKDCLNRIRPRLVFTTQYDIFSLTAAQGYRVHHLIRSMEPIEFKFHFPYRQELADLLKRTPTSVSSPFLQSELRQAYQVESVVLYPVFDNFHPVPRRASGQWITLINFSVPKGGHLFSFLSTQFKNENFMALSGNKNLFRKIKQQGFDNLYYFDTTCRMDKVYPGVKVLIVPSLVEDACPRVILEAMAYSIPILANRIGGIPDIIPDQENLIDIQNRRLEQIIRDYTLRLERLISNPEYYRYQCEKSLQASLKWQTMLEENRREFLTRIGLL